MKLMIFFLSGTISSSQKSQGCLLEDLQHHIYWIARRLGGRLPSHPQRRQEYLRTI